MSETFLRQYPTYLSTRAIDDLRATEFRRLDANGHAYLDYTGGGLYAECQVRDHHALLAEHVFGNPHSRNLTSCAMSAIVDRTRADVLRFFHASPDEYMVVFTPNSTGALKILGESYPFGAGTAFTLTADNHNSVNGIREFARHKGAHVRYVPIAAPDLRVPRDALRRALDDHADASHKLFACPAQSNFSGVQHPLHWIEEARDRGWDVLLDAASFVPTNRLDLSQIHPDFVDISFYKMFGYPTGVGCLLVRKAAATKLVRPWYSGGTITFSTVATQDHYLTPGAARFEDGTVNYLSIPAVSIGLAFIESIGIDTIHTRVMCLADYLLKEMAGLRHRDGTPLIRIYGPASTEGRGATIQMNFFDRAGHRIECYTVERLASAERISLRAGCHCNPGAREAALGFTKDDLDTCFAGKDTITFDQFRRQIVGKTTGALRLSIGLATNIADVERYLTFARTFLDKAVAELPPAKVSAGCTEVGV